MLIKCPECDTRFNLSADRLQPEGMRVRCAKCRHVFPVWTSDPDASATPSELSPTRAETTHSATDDLWDESFEVISLEHSDKASETTSVVEKTEAPAGDWEIGLSESDLGLDDLGDEPDAATFGESGATEGNSLSEAQAVRSPRLTAESSEVSVSDKELDSDTSLDEFGFEEESLVENPFAEEIDSPLSAEEFFPEEEPPEDLTNGLPGFSFGKNGLEAFSFDMNDTKSFPPEENNFFTAEIGGTAKTDIFDDSLDATTFDGLAGKSSRNNDGLDFKMSFGTSNQGDPTTTLEDVEDIVIGRVGKTKPTGHRQASASSEFDTGNYRLTETQKRRGPIATVLRLFFFLFLFLGIVMGYLFWRNDTTDIERIFNLVLGEQESSAPVSQIRLPLPKSFFIMNKKAGRLFVIHGEAINGYRETRSAIAVKGMLHDGQGKVVMQQTVFCGNAMELATLKTAPFSQLEENMNNQFGNTLSNLNVASGKPIPYMIIFRNLPPDVTEFTVEVADSKPGVTQ